MPRKGPAPKRPLIIDPVYGSPVVTQLINKVLLDGKKTTAEAIVYGALEGVREKTQSDPVVVLKRALDNVRPALEVRSRRVGGATYQVPVEVRPVRSGSRRAGGRWTRARHRWSSEPPRRRVRTPTSRSHLRRISATTRRSALPGRRSRGSAIRSPAQSTPRSSTASSRSPT